MVRIVLGLNPVLPFSFLSSPPFSLPILSRVIIITFLLGRAIWGNIQFSGSVLTLPAVRPILPPSN